MWHLHPIEKFASQDQKMVTTTGSEWGWGWEDTGFIPEHGPQDPLVNYVWRREGGQRATVLCA